MTKTCYSQKEGCDMKLIDLPTCSRAQPALSKAQSTQNMHVYTTTLQLSVYAICKPSPCNSRVLPTTKLQTPSVDILVAELYTRPMIATRARHCAALLAPSGGTHLLPNDSGFPKCSASPHIMYAQLSNVLGKISSPCLPALAFGSLFETLSGHLVPCGFLLKQPQHTGSSRARPGPHHMQAQVLMFIKNPSCNCMALFGNLLCCCRVYGHSRTW